MRSILVLVAVALGAVAPWLGIAFGILAIGLLAAVGSALSGVFNAALYRRLATRARPPSAAAPPRRSTWSPLPTRTTAGRCAFGQVPPFRCT